MCGIAGLILGNPERIQPILQAMLNAQCHRGPDDEGLTRVPFGSNHLGLGHRRLAILDLSLAGHQPMVHPETGDVLSYNGEIYNYQCLRRGLESAGCQFRGHSDTEVLLHGLSRYGPDFLARLEGMFALAFFSRQQQKLLLARDPLGIKPLYLARVSGAFLFASEVRALLASGLVGTTIAHEGLAGYLAYGAVAVTQTLFRDIVALPPGTWQIFSPSDQAAGFRLQPVRFWNFPVPISQADGPDLVERIRATLSAAVRDHMVSDVPMGVFLSSGMDSTAIASLATQHSSQVRTFTVGFAEHQALDESVLAEQIAQRIGTRHATIRIGIHETENLMSDWLGDMDLPSMDGLNVYLISKAVKMQGITVALSGQGGDELFGGYPAFEEVPRARQWWQRLQCLPAGLRAPVVRLLMAGASETTREKALDMVESDGSVSALYFQRRRTLSNRQLAALGVGTPAVDGTLDSSSAEVTNNLPIMPDDPVSAIAVLESRYYLGPMLLRDSDVFGMAHSLEIRVPFLDRRMLDLMYRIPGQIRVLQGRADKHLLRKAFADVYPSKSLQQGKRGFVLPIAHWMRTTLRERCVAGLSALKGAGCMDPRGIDAVWQAFEREPLSPAWSRAWELCVLGIYLEGRDRRQAMPRG